MRTPVVLASSLVLLGLWACDHKAPIAPTPPPWLPGVVQEQALAQAPDAQLVGNLYQAVTDGDADRTDWNVTLEQGKCYWLSGAGDQGIEELALYLWDPEGDKVDKLKSKTNKVILAHCPTVSGLFKFQAKVLEGRGHYQVGIYAKAAPEGGAPTAAPTATPTAAPAPVADLGAACDADAKAAAPEAARVGNHFTGTADETDWYTQLDADKCYWLIGRGSDGVKELWLYLWGPGTPETRITANKAESNKVVVGHCPDKAGMYHFQAKVGSGSGEYAVGLYAKKK